MTVDPPHDRDRWWWAWDGLSILCITILLAVLALMCFGCATQQKASDGGVSRTGTLEAETTLGVRTGDKTMSAGGNVSYGSPWLSFVLGAGLVGYMLLNELREWRRRNGRRSRAPTCKADQ